MPIQAPAWTDYLNCPVCCREFGAPPRSPISLCCGHTVCKHCLSHLHRRQCPFDQTVIQVEEEELVVNTALLQLAGYTPPAQPYHPPCIQALCELDRQRYDAIVRSVEELATYLKFCGNANGSGGGRLSRPMQRKLVSLVQCSITDEEGRGRAARAARSLGERTVTELILQHQNPQQLSANLWAAVRARGCQFLGPAMQEEVLKLVLLALEDGSALSRKVLVMFVVQRLEPHFPQASKTSIGHVVQLLYRASCFKVSKRESDSSLMQLKEEFRTYESLRREHDAQIVQIATEAGLRIAPDQWSSLLYGDTGHKSHMQSIIDKLQTPQSFAQSVQELFIALQRTGDPAQLVVMGRHLDRLASIDPNTDAKNPSWRQLDEIMVSLKEVVSGLIHYLQQQALGRDANHNQKHTLTERPAEINTNQPSPQSLSTPTHGKYKVSMCRDAAARSYCPRGNSCTFAHSEEERERFRYAGHVSKFPFANRNPQQQVTPPTATSFVYSPHHPNALNYIASMQQQGRPMATYAEVVAQDNVQQQESTNNQTQSMNGHMIQNINSMPLTQNGMMQFSPLVSYNNVPANYGGLLTMAPPNQALPALPVSSSQNNFPGYPYAATLTLPVQVHQMNGQALIQPLMPTMNPSMNQVRYPTMGQPMNQNIGQVVNLQEGYRDIASLEIPTRTSPYQIEEPRNNYSNWYVGLQGSSPPWGASTEDAFSFENMMTTLPPAQNAEEVFSYSSGVATGDTELDDYEELEEELQALKRRFDKELDK